MSDVAYYIACALLTLGVLAGISMMSRVRTAVAGNLLSAACTAGAVLLTMYRYAIFTLPELWICLGAGLVCGLVWARRIKMIDMPQVVALLNGFGGAASALVAAVSLLGGGGTGVFGLATAGLALAVGMVTLTGSLIAAGKLHKVLGQRPVVWPAHQAITTAALLAVAAAVVLVAVQVISRGLSVALCALISGFFGVAFAIRVGGADMPITISLLNSLSGVAGAIAGMAIGDPLLVAVGGVVGASGLLLTQIMCRSMNRRLADILLGRTSAAPAQAARPAAPEAQAPVRQEAEETPERLLRSARRVILIPGYGMAIAQAQRQVWQLAQWLERNGAQVDFAIHPVAGRMPGHMNVLLAEADVPYEKLREMDDINPEFADCDVAIVIGANDVVNPAANEAEGTPIYGMPVLDAGRARHVIICNFDRSPGYAGVPNPLYDRAHTVFLPGNAADTVQALLDALDGEAEAGRDVRPEGGTDLHAILDGAKRVILIPGYGMAIAQAQREVWQLAETLERRGAQVDFAIHPVAGRMPGHMNVLLAEADVPYEKLREMDDINPEFADCDVAIVIGANDVVNPAANEAEGTPIYGMPVLDAGRARHVIICNFDRSPGYAGVPNPLYDRENTVLLLGDAADTVRQLIEAV